jgi:hypothetical protein
VPRRYDARRVLEGLVGKEIRTLTGCPNTVLALEGDTVRVATTRSPAGQLVPIKWVQDALDRLAAKGEVDIVPAPDVGNLDRLANVLRVIEAHNFGTADLDPAEFPFDPLNPDDLREGGN